MKKLSLVSIAILAVMSEFALAVDWTGSPHRFQGDVHVGYGTNYANFIVRGKNTSPIVLIQNAALGNTVMVVDRLGNMGLGTAAPSYTLEVIGAIRASGNILSDGNIGIGTTSPTSRLHVNGTAALGTGVTSATTNQVVVGTYNDTRTNDNGINHTEGVFVVGSGGSTTTRSNSIRVLTNGTVLVKPSGDLGMGNFQNGPTP